MSTLDLTVTFVDYKTPELSVIVVESFEKFVTRDFSLKFVVVENSNFDLSSYFADKKNIIIENRPTTSTFSQGHGEGLESTKKYVDTEYTFTCHTDVCVTSSKFFDEIKKCIEDRVVLAGVCEDKHPDRVKAYHCSGLLVRSDVYKNVSLLPDLPRIDTTDKLTLFCKDNDMKMRLFKNTYNDSSLVDTINSPFRELGKTCGVDRCLDRSGNVMYIHQGRGTTKYTNENKAVGKISTRQWIEICEYVLRGKDGQA